jgi:hypothetical protein
MVESSTALAPFVKSIFHPSDFSKASELAFARALAIALIRRTELVIMHAGRESIGDWRAFRRCAKLSSAGRCSLRGVGARHCSTD